MTARILKGSKQEIAQQVANMDGDVREAIVFIEDPAEASKRANPAAPPEDVEDIFKEMEPYMVHVGNVDYSREGIYTRKRGE